MQGKIIGNISNVYKIKTESKEYNAYARGKLKNNEITPLVGDNVEIQVTDEEKSEAIIEKVEQRKNDIKYRSNNICNINKTSKTRFINARQTISICRKIRNKCNNNY